MANIFSKLLNRIGRLFGVKSSQAPSSGTPSPAGEKAAASAQGETGGIRLGFAS